MSNWWKRFFGLEEDEEGESLFPVERARENTRRRTHGRFEDPNRQIDVKVLHQYPDQGTGHPNQRMSTTPLYPTVERLRESRGTHEKRPNRQEWDERPAYIRRQPREEKKPPLEKKDDKGRGRVGRQEEKPEATTQKRARFTPTNVASPVYGYRERPMPSNKKQPIRNERSFDGKREPAISVERSAFNRAASEIGRTRIIENQAPYERPNPIPSLEKGSTSQVEQVQDTLQDTRNNFESDSRTVAGANVAYESLLNTQIETESKTQLEESIINRSRSSVSNEMDDERSVETAFVEQEDVEEDQSVAPVFVEQEDVEEDQSVAPVFVEQEDVEEDQSVAPVFVEQEDVEKDQLSPVIVVNEERAPSNSTYEKEEPVNRSEQGAVRQGESSQPDRVETVPSPTRTERNSLREMPRKSAIPYNVMMTRSDQLALRKTEQQPVQSLSLGLLNTAPVQASENDLDWIEQKKAELSESLDNFNVKADVLNHIQGPTVTRFEIRLHPGVKVNKVIGLTEDLKLTLSAKQIRIAPVPGKNTVGIEIPNQTRKPVFLKSILQSSDYQEARSPLTAVLGQDITGQHVVTDLAKMPHGLIAGATGSGKSVCIHSLIVSLIYKASPDELRMILIDPKVVELATYREMPHLAAPVITQPREAALALKWAVNEMERRYQLFADTGVRDLSRYNELIKTGKARGQKIPYIVIIIDELADLMMTSPQDVEAAICRIAQKARAAGIHMLLATQRPSVDVITGLIKSNIPTRIAFGVSSQADSRTILDMSGAERLLGQGDMLFSENGSRSLRRLQGTFVTDEEIERITDTFHHLEGPEYLFDVSDLQEKQAWDEEEDDLFEEAGYFVIEQGQASVSSLQRRFRIGYNRAARLVDQLEAASIISEANGSKPRQVLVDKGTFEQAYTHGEKTQI